MENDIKDDKKLKDQNDHNLSLAIVLACELESAFKLFSYRITQPAMFVSKVDELVDYYRTNRSFQDLEVKEPEIVE